MRIAVVGTGAVGGYFGGRLSLAGENVVFLARGEHLRAIRESGLRVDSADGDFVVHPAQATDDAAEVGSVDVVLLAVKGWQVPGAIETMRPLIGEETFIAPLLNGVEAPDQLAAAFGDRRVIGGLCGLFGSLVGPAHIQNTQPRPWITIGELDNKHTERIERLNAVFAAAGLQTKIAPDIRVALWEKLLFVSPVGAVGAVTRAPIGVVRTISESRALLEGVMTEVFHVARAHGVHVADDVVTRTLAFWDAESGEATTSMQRDILDGRPSELETQVGAVVRAAHVIGMRAPHHEFLYASLLPQERHARDEIDFPE
ncbi:MAG TPA: 2-dehydropantoate 2-reductase [Ktedonobacterales bacterium]